MNQNQMTPTHDNFTETSALLPAITLNSVSEKWCKLLHKIKIMYLG